MYQPHSQCLKHLWLQNVKSPLDLLVEGAGNSKDLRNRCRSAAEAGIDDMKPRYSDIALKQATTRQQMKRVTIKATYREDMISFPISFKFGYNATERESGQEAKAGGEYF
ncbi:hypothetical protein V6N13_027865 [Hibiscus sabdariffa]|uniref:Uncharacterized protein n=1 Tax=Hibiscus sabdariffa TaxID=183260 RepID=A0ABR2CFU0_9ROSI